MGDQSSSGFSLRALFDKLKPYLAMVSLQFGYAGMYIITVLYMKREMSHYVLAVYRHAVATIVIAPFALVFERMNKVYVVFKGRSPGIYLSWPECHDNVNRFPGAVYRAYQSYAVAQSEFQRYMATHNRPMFVTNVNQEVASATEPEVALIGQVQPLAQPLDNGRQHQHIRSPLTQLLIACVIFMLGFALGSILY